MKRKLHKHSNWPVIALSALAIYVVLYPCYVYLDSWWNRGIYQRNGMIEVDLKAMSNFEMNQSTATDTDIPQAYRNLDGKHVILVGEMWSPDVAEGRVKSFQLCYSITQCCFNGPPKMQHFVRATALPSAQCVPEDGLIRVVGILHVGVEMKEGRIQSIYRIDVEKLEPVPS
jgi:hypothetical protein